jgi:hypothetical protein
MTRRPLVLLSLSVVLISVLAFAFVAEAKPGNSLNAKACQKGGYLNLYRQDGTRFASESACTSYAAQGGVLVTATPTPTNTPTNTPSPMNTPIPLSAGCTELNNPVYDGVYEAKALTLPFDAGEVIAVRATGAPNNTTLYQLHVVGDAGLFDLKIQNATASFPLTITIPVSQTVEVRWFNHEHFDLTWTVSCRAGS